MVIARMGVAIIHEASLKKQLTLTALLFCAVATRTIQAQTWTAVQGTPGISAFNPLLLKDGTVIMQDADTSNWYKLSPDTKGNYVDGKWSKVASMPNTWGPLYYASQVMTDGRVFAMGGEYNFGNPEWYNGAGIYDPVADKWTSITAPWGSIGDMASVQLPNGLVYFIDAVSNSTAAFNPLTNAIQTPYGQTNPDYNNEGGLTLLPDGNLFFVYCWQAQVAEKFNTTSLTWSNLPAMPYNVIDLKDAEVGPALVEYSGKVVQFGGNGSNVEFNPSTNTWSSMPSFPMVSSTQIDCADAPAVELPNGMALVDAGPGYGDGGCYFFTWDGTSLTAVTGPPDSAENVDFAGNFLLLPNGQVLFTDQSSQVQLYTPSGSPKAAWAPTITTVPSQLKQGSPYTIEGTQFNGLTGGSAYGDDEQNETNYPIIKLRNNTTGDVTYCKEYSPSTMAICTGSQIVNCHFTLPLNAELGASTIQVVTNGIPSAPVAVTVVPPLSAYAVSLYEGTTPNPSSEAGQLSALSQIDGLSFTATSVTDTLNGRPTGVGQVCAVEADFKVGTGIAYLKALATASASTSVTEQLFMYDWVGQAFVQVANGAFGSGQTSISGTPTLAASRFISSSGETRVIIRGVRPPHISSATYKMSVDFVGLSFG